jgi:nucleotide-binding universal stress UspA family protein
MRLLVAIDGSDAAEHALAHALEVAEAMDAALTVVHAVDPDVYQESGFERDATLAEADRGLLLESLERAENRGLDHLEDAASFAADRGQEVHTDLLYGDPAAAIPDYVDDEGIDAVFVGHRGRSERTELLVGSVAKAVVERVTVPVTVVR